MGLRTAETRTITNGLEVHEAVLILRAETASQRFLSVAHASF